MRECQILRRAGVEIFNSTRINGFCLYVDQVQSEKFSGNQNRIVRVLDVFGHVLNASMHSVPGNK